MEKIILIKYGELTTKKANRNLFIGCMFATIFVFFVFYGMVYGLTAKVYYKIVS